MSALIQLHDVVALTVDTPATHFETGRPLCLRRGQIGTVVMCYDGSMCEVEFADRQGHAYALLPIRTEQLMVLHDSPEHAAA